MFFQEEIQAALNWHENCYYINVYRKGEGISYYSIFFAEGL